MKEKLDLRGLVCPEPVIATKKVLDKPEVKSIEALVDDDVCVANLERLARSCKVSVSVKDMSGYYSVLLLREGTEIQMENAAGSASLSSSKEQSKTGTVVFLSKDELGAGDTDFSKTLLNVFLQSMYEGGHKPRAILMANSGVKLLSKSSQAKKVLDDFRSAGTEVLACGLCVEYYGLKEEIAKEQITNMFAICEYLNAADKLIQF